MNKTPKRRLSIWRPLSPPKAVLVEEMNVLKASHAERSIVVNEVTDRIGGERKDRFYRNAIQARPDESGVSWRKLLKLSFVFLVLTVAAVNYELVYLKLVELFEMTPSKDALLRFYNSLSLDAFSRFMGELGLKVTHLDQ